VVRFPPRRDVLRSLEWKLPQGACTDSQLQARQTWRCGIHSSWSLPLIVFRRLSIRIARTGRRRPLTFEPVDVGPIIHSQPRLPFYKHRKENWGWPRRLSFRGSASLIGHFVPTAFLIVTTDSWSPVPASRLNSPRNKERP